MNMYSNVIFSHKYTCYFPMSLISICAFTAHKCADVCVVCMRICLYIFVYRGISYANVPSANNCDFNH